MLLLPVSLRADAWTEIEESVGRMTLKAVLAEEGQVKEPLLQRWADRVGGEVARQSTRHRLHYRFCISGTTESNAYSLPGGYVVLTSGLLNHISSDEELAGVLAHEIAHSDDRDFQRLLREQLAFLGLLGWARGQVKEGWVLAGQVLQMLQGLRSSRRHEAQADYHGVRICLQAGYDPEGLVSFLRTTGGEQHGLGKLLATHPPGPDRVAATQARITQLRQEQPRQVRALVESLRQRGHLKRALAVAGTIPETTALVQELTTQRDEGAATESIALPPETQTAVRAARDDLRRAEQELHRTEQGLRRELERFYADRQIATALQYAQALSPELEETKYLSTVARAYWVLQRASREAQRQGEVLARGASVRLGWERVATDLTADKVTMPATANSLPAQRTQLAAAAQVFLVEAEPAVRQTTEQLRTAAARCGELTRATRMLAAAFLVLVASGSDEPLGRLTYAHFLLLQSDILAAEGRVRRSEQASEAALQAVLTLHLRVLQVALTTTHCLAGPAQGERDVSLVAARIGVEPSALATAAQSSPFGEATLTLLDPQVQAQSLAGLQVRDCLLRIAYLDLTAERDLTQ